MTPAHLAKPLRRLLPEHVRAERKEPQMVNSHVEVFAPTLYAVEAIIHGRIPAPIWQVASVTGCRAFCLYPLIDGGHTAESGRDEEGGFHTCVARLQPRPASPPRSRRAGYRAER